MIPILVVGHGGFAAGLGDAIEMILGGPQDATAYLALAPEDDPAELARRIDDTLDDLGVPADGEAIVLADLFGASPANAAATLLQRRPGLHVIAGVNLAMALELLVLREGTPAPELAEIALARGRDAIKDAGAIVRAAVARVTADNEEASTAR
jgi:PTS system N-acetylgalactosamine-specific IIA component